MQHILNNRPLVDVVEYVARERFAWPGGYALGIVTDDGRCLCSACVEREKDRILEDLRDGCKGSGFYPAAAYMADSDDDAGEWNEWTPTTCDHCNRPITDATNNK